MQASIAPARQPGYKILLRRGWFIAFSAFPVLRCAFVEEQDSSELIFCKLIGKLIFCKLFCCNPGIPKKETPMNININDKAPEFTLQDENEKEVSLKGLRGKVVVLYFYPRADTPGCTIEACEFRDTYKKIQKTGAVIYGISPDTPKAQKKFQEKFKLPFSLLADADKKVANEFGVVQEKNMYGKKVMGIARTTFIIGPDGKVEHIFPKVKPEGHAEEVLAYLKEIAKGAA